MFFKGSSAILLIFHLAGGAASAQTPEHQHDMPMPSTGWQWTPTASLFAGQNDQFRKFTDFHVFESQNWFMLDGHRAVSHGALTISTMLSLEPLTMMSVGSPQVFQTGETFQGVPLIDYQHPHDFLMQLSARYDRQWTSMRAYAGAALVGEPTLGPPSFMHRASAGPNPQVPLTHHFLDSTHITPGVISGGVGHGNVGVEASVFHGREPDENRWDVDLGALDSWAMRGYWMRGGWSAQISGGHLTLPEAVEPYDMGRLTASVSYTGSVASRAIAVTAAWGQNREFYGHYNAGLVEAAWHLSPRWQLYSRGELAPKNILTAGGFHPKGTTHPHIISRIGALTVRAQRTLAGGSRGLIGIGGDVTTYLVPGNLLEDYGSPWAVHSYVQMTWGKPHVHAGR